MATSSYARWATSATGPCSKGCTAEKLKKEFMTDVKSLPLYKSTTRIFWTKNRSWRLTYETGAKISPLQAMLDIISRHLVGYASPGSDLTIDNTAVMFDPFISFSSSPMIAGNFASTRDHGAIMMISVPIGKIMRPSLDGCQMKNFDSSNLYDLYPCFRTAGSMEAEYDAFLSLPQEYVYSIHRFGNETN